MKLTYFLFKETVQEFGEALDARKLEGECPFVRATYSGALAFDGAVYFQINRKTPPKWFGFVSSYVDIGSEPPMNQTNGAIILLRESGRIFGVTLGFGFHAIDDSKVVQDFGHTCSLKAVDLNNLRSVDARNIGYLTKQKRTYTSLSTGIEEFDFDASGELLHKVSGVPSDEGLGKALSGSDAASLNSDVTFETLGNKCSSLLSIYTNNQDSPLLDLARRVTPVREPDMLAILDGHLVDALNGPVYSNLSIALDSVEWERVSSVKIYRGYKSKESGDLTLSLMSSFWNEHCISIEERNPKKIFVIALDEEGNAISKRTDLYNLLSFETDHDGGRFVLSLGKWYRIAADFLGEINRALNDIEQIDEVGFLPNIQEDMQEGTYNESTARTNGYLLLDKVNFRHGGSSQIEVCDLLTQDMKFICVKRETESATLSHLFAQGSVSATLLNDLDEYRTYISGQLPAGWQLPDAERSGWKDQITFVYAITSHRQGNLVDLLPFFSKVNLRNHARTIGRMGFRVALRKIEVDRNTQ